MLFNIGDKVLFKKKKGEGKIISFINSDKVLILDNFGFEVEVALSELIPSSSDYISKESYGEDFLNKDLCIDEEKIQDNNKNSSSRIKIDLHTEKLNHDLEGLSNTEIINIQIRYFEKEINFFRKKNVEELIVVHGIGSGLLKDRVHESLVEYGLRFYLSIDEGSTIVFL